MVRKIEYLMKTIILGQVTGNYTQDSKPVMVRDSKE